MREHGVMDARTGHNGMRHVAAQMVFVGLLSAALTYATSQLNYRTGLNLFWMIALPVVLGISRNRGAGQKTLMALTLICVSLLAVGTVGWSLGGI